MIQEEQTLDWLSIATNLGKCKNKLGHLAMARGN